MYWYVTTFLVAVATLIFYWFAAWKRDYWKERGFPHIKSKLLVGDLVQNYLGRATFTESLTGVYFRLKDKKFGGFMQLMSPKLILCDPEVINNVLIKGFKSFHDRSFAVDAVEEPLFTNLTSLKGAAWRSLRYKLAPTFTSGKLKVMFDQMSTCADEIMTYIKQESGPFEARKLSALFNMNVTGSIAFGIKVEAHKDDPKSQRFVEMATRSFSPSRLSQFILVLFITAPRLKTFLKLKFIDDEVNEFFTKLVEDTIKHRKMSGEIRNDFLQLLMDIKDKERNPGKVLAESRKETTEEDRELIDQLPETSDQPTMDLTDEQIVGNTFVFISGGAETISSGLDFTMYELAVNPKIQEKLFNELNNAVANTGLTHKTITTLPYLDQVINEVLRLHPPAGQLDRMCTESVTIPGTDKVVRAGDNIVIPVAALHIDPEYWEDPLTFNPSRFEDPQSVPKGVYMPFGAGPRFCIAQRYAIQTMKLFTAKVILNYKLKLSSKTKLPLKMLATSFQNHVEGGIWVDFVERHRT